jgi:hypothetical protein
LRVTVSRADQPESLPAFNAFVRGEGQKTDKLVGDADIQLGPR